MSTTLGILGQLPSLCSPQGCLTIIATVLYLVTGVLKDLALAPASGPRDPASPVSQSLAVTSCLASLQRLVSIRFPSHPDEERRFQLVSQSGLLKILDLAKTAPAESKLDEISLLLAIKVYLVSSTRSCVSSPNIMYPCVNAFSACLQSRDVQIQTAAIKILSEIFREANIENSVTYLQATAPQVITMALGQNLNHPTDQAELRLALESLVFLESMLQIAEAERKSQLLNIHIPVLINFLSDDPNSAPQFKRLLHDTTLAKLTKLGAQWPAEFKSLLHSDAGMRGRVERAVLHNAERQKALSQAAQQSAALPAAPSIKLKMDFSNFK